MGISAGDRCEHHHPVAGLSAGEGLVLVLLGGGGEDLDPPVPERLHGALTILELLPGRVQAVRSTVILGSGEHDTGPRGIPFNGTTPNERSGSLAQNDLYFTFGKYRVFV